MIKDDDDADDGIDPLVRLLDADKDYMGKGSSAGADVVSTTSNAMGIGIRMGMGMGIGMGLGADTTVDDNDAGPPLFDDKGWAHFWAEECEMRAQRDVCVQSENHGQCDNIPSCLVSFKHWTNMLLKWRKCVEASSWNHELRADICPPASNIKEHVPCVLDGVLSEKKFRNCHFKFGISSMPGVRWTKFPDYSLLDLMVLLYTTEAQHS